MVFDRRTLLSAVVMFILLVVLGELETAGFVPRIEIFRADINSPTYNMFFSALGAAAIGAYLAGDKFFIAAALVIVVYWALGIRLLYAVVAPTGQYDLSDILLSGLPHLLLAIVAACIGALLGSRYYAGRNENEEAAS